MEIEMSVPSLKEIEQFVYEAASEGYGSENVATQKQPKLPGAVVISYARGTFLYLDTYYTAPGSQRSSGMTVVMYRDTPVWTMLYGGWYPDELIPFLKESLRQYNPSSGVFTGCRGPLIFVGEEYRYENYPRQGTFGNFEGEEYILQADAPSIRTSGKKFVLGSHWYKGMSLLPGTTSTLF